MLAGSRKQPLAAFAPEAASARISAPVSGSIPGIVVGGTGSGCGKTVSTLALLCALKARGLRTAAAKAGPDFIDTAFHAGITGRPAANLDIWMCGAASTSPAEDLSASRPDAAVQALGRLRLRMEAPYQGLRPDILVIEGAMGLYDGAAGAGNAAGTGSTAQLAALLQLPVLLVLSAKGLGQSIAALAEGFLRHQSRHIAADKSLSFAGLLCSHVGGEVHKDMLRKALAFTGPECNAPLRGFLPVHNAPKPASRHLGLVEAREFLPGLDQAAAAAWFEAHCDLDALLRDLKVPLRREPAPDTVAGPGASSGASPGAAIARCDGPLRGLSQGLPQDVSGVLSQELSAGPVHELSHESAQVQKHGPANDAALPARAFFPALHCLPQASPTAGQRPLVGIACDAAFSFCYADLPALLQELGADIAFFSPLADAAPPAGCAGLYFPGGYPELHAAALADNTAMRTTLQASARQGLPVYGECGGYIYLMQSLRTLDGTEHSMSGLLPLRCRMGERRAALGYRIALPEAGAWPDDPCENPLEAQHEAQPQAQADHSATVPGARRGHEFHYAHLESSVLPPRCRPLARIYDSRDTDLGLEGCLYGATAGSWLHLYPEGNRAFWTAWLGLLCARAQQR